MTAPITYATKQAALDHVAEVRADRLRGVDRDHRDGTEHFDRFAADWIGNGGRRGHLAPRTRELYEDLLARDLAYFHGVALHAITPREVRAWHTQHTRTTAKSARKRGSIGDARVREAYALFRAVFTTAVQDRTIAENPCRIDRAGHARSEERPYLSPEVLARIVAEMPDHYATPMRLAFGAYLRLGELVALQRRDYDAERHTLSIERQAVIVKGATEVTPTKTGNATEVVLPPSVAAMIEAHLGVTNGFGKSAMFTRPTGEPITRNALQQAWRKATKALGVSQFHVHDVRHASLTVAAQAGATTRELMARAGHRTTAAAMIYQHVAEQRNATIAERMDALAGGTFGAPIGTRMAREG